MRERRIAPRITECGAVLVAFATFAAGCGGGSSVTVFQTRPPIVFPSPMNSDVMRISMDPFSNPSSQHATQVEPDAVAVGSTIVAAFQSGRLFSAGSSDIGFATSRDGGLSWLTGFLPGLSKVVQPGNPFDSVSDPSIAYDAAHGVWLIASLPSNFSAGTTAILVSRSSDGIVWSNPISVAPSLTSFDKDWITCDKTPTSPFYGRCYLEWDTPLVNGLIRMSTSTDGGITWGPVLNTADLATGVGGEPLVQPNGTVIVPIDDYNEQNVRSFVSHDGGASWSATVSVATIADHLDGGGLRSGPLPSAAMDAGGTVYIAWQDCRYRAGCAENDIVLSTTNDGAVWTSPVRVPIDSPTSSIDHFLPVIAIAPTTLGSSSHIGITYFYYPNTVCGLSNCQLTVGFISSEDSGTTWGARVKLAGPMSLTWLPSTRAGYMVGDYMATVYAGMQPVDIFAVAYPPSGALDEAMYAPKPGAIGLSSSRGRSSAGERPIPGARSDHPPRRLPPDD
jgi:hypothetical protein